MNKLSFGGGVSMGKEIKKKIEAFIFDLDGVITDTAEYHYRAWKRLADEENLPFTREDNEKLRGVSRRASLELILKGRSLPEEKMLELMARKNGYYRDYLESVSGKDLLPGAVDLLRELKSKGFRLALASASKNAPTVVDALGIASYFEVIADGSSVERTKPAPDLFLYAAKKLNVPPELCIVVEDAEAGIAAARQAGMATIGIGPPERVGDADFVYPSVAAIRLEDIFG
ncbi:MAG: beta-phosphoglucomutase [Bacillota bacterium]|nr:beta-phosphoglucomutase [Bacillota bacterium]